MTRFPILAALYFVTGPAFAQALPAPDDSLTPGAVRMEVARRLTPSIKATVAQRYHVTGGHDPSCGAGPCELDHRIPWGCHGATLPDNLSFQTYGDWQKKDRLEHWVERQVTLHRLSVEDCQEMFRAPNDWRERYRIVFKEEP